MLEVYVLVPVKKTAGAKVAGGIVLALAVVCLLAACMAGGVILLPVGVVGAVAGYMLMGYSKEFEYSYFDGEARFAKVLNKSRRKSLGTYPMADVIQIAPAGDRSVSRYENPGNAKVLDYTSHDKDKPYYDMVVQKDGETLLIKFEPDEKYLEAVEYKYRQKVIRRMA